MPAFVVLGGHSPQQGADILHLFVVATIGDDKDTHMIHGLDISPHGWMQNG